METPTRVLICALMWTSAFLAQQTRPPFSLGMTDDELHSSFGMPTAYYNYSTKQIINGEKDAEVARQVSGDREVEDMYEMRTAVNTYLFRTLYIDDTRQSRLRPTKRLLGVSFELDKPIEDIRSLLADLPEAVSLCSQECGIFTHDDTFGRTLFVEQKNPSPEEIKETGLIAESCGGDGSKEAWVKSLEFHLKGKRIESGLFGLHTKGQNYGTALTLTDVWQSSSKQQ